MSGNSKVANFVLLFINKDIYIWILKTFGFKLYIALTFYINYMEKPDEPIKDQDEKLKNDDNRIILIRESIIGPFFIN